MKRTSKKIQSETFLYLDGKITVNATPEDYTAFITGETECCGFGTTIDESVGCLVCAYKDRFAVIDANIKI
jgi:hypothetical protein